MKFPPLAAAALACAAMPITHACDLCAVYSATHAQGLAPSAWSASVATQFTHFATLRRDGDRVPDEIGQRLDSTITQWVISHGFSDRLHVQLNVPLITRSFRRPEGMAVESGRERGLGDVSLLGRFEIFRRDRVHSTVIWNVLGGVKFPTGSTDRIREELLESHAGPEEMNAQHAGDHDHDEAMASGVHGHDLTLGTGSTDGIIGSSVYLRRDRFFLTGFVQYALRSRGDHEYRFANDLTWEAAPGAYVMVGHTHTVGVQVVASGEHKSLDTLAGESMDDTGIDAIYLGPRVTYTWGLHLAAAIGADFPLSMRNTALQLTPSYRLRGNLTWTF